MIVTFNVEEASRVVYRGPYTVTLVAVDNQDALGTRGDFNSTLVVTVDNGFENGTDITCQVFGNQDHLLIYKFGKLGIFNDTTMLAIIRRSPISTI